MRGFVRLRSAVWLALAVIALSPVTSRAEQGGPVILEHVQERWR
jgi:hypothetical protein